MKHLVPILFIPFSVFACGGSLSGTCNHCEGWRLDTEACEEQALELGCASAEVVEVTDESCGVGQPETTHLQCQYNDCPVDAEFECDQFASD